jgi:Na+-driven multidrug efflux pump
LLRWTISPLGPEVNAALGIGFSALEGVSWPLYAGVMMAVSSLIGRQLGANDIEGTHQTIRMAMPMATILGTICALIFWFGAKPLCQFFTQDPLVLENAVLYAQILAFSQLFVAYEATFEGVLGGAGHNDYQLWMSMPLNVVRIPLAYLLAMVFGYGAVGVWWAINITTYSKAIGKGLLVHYGKWRETKL